LKVFIERSSERNHPNLLVESMLSFIDAGIYREIDPIEVGGLPEFEWVLLAPRGVVREDSVVIRSETLTY
jgi:hypothetical protein